MTTLTLSRTDCLADGRRFLVFPDHCPGGGSGVDVDHSRNSVGRDGRAAWRYRDGRERCPVGSPRRQSLGATEPLLLAGLRPGQYGITVAVPQYRPQAKTVEILVGQTVTANFRITPDVVYTEAVSVVGDTRLVDTRKPEVTTNVGREQLENLPQSSAQLPQLRRARARRAAVQRRAQPQRLLGGPRSAPDQRVRRRRQPEERHHRGRRGRPGRESRQPVPAERDRRLPRADPELQGRVRAGRQLDHLHRDTLRRQRAPRRAVRLVPGPAS